MQKDLIKELCLTQDLIDIAGTGTASQSSTSKYSKENDAQRAVLNKEYKDFAFHTEKELNPWWQVEFKMPVAVEYIIINNRKRSPFDERASNITVSAYDENSNEILLHSDTTYFGSDLEGCPLIIPLKSKVSLKKLRITLLKENYLHLSNIRFLVKDPLKNIKQKFFVANRQDGMGERFRALLNAMLLSEKNDCNFIFSWETKNRDFHATREKNLIFSQEFQKNHIVERKKIEEMELYPLQGISLLFQDQAKDYDGYLVQQNNVSTILPYPYNDFNSIDYKRAFDKIGFSEEMKAAKVDAENIPLADKIIAIHIRAGDIVFGQFRWEPIFYGKVTPLFLLEKTITNTLEDGFKIVIFGQDDKFCNYLSEKYNLIYSKNLLRKNYNDSQVALFDIVLMSRCQVIIAGSSGFATLASWIGGSKRKIGYEYFPKLEDKLEAFDQFYEDKEGFLYSDDIHPLMKAFSIIQFVYKFEKRLAVYEKISYLKECINLDNNNFYYKVFLTSLYYESNKIKEGDSYLESQLKGGQFKRLEMLAKTVKWNNTTALTHLIDSFKSAATKGSATAAIILLLDDIAMKRDVEIEFYSNIIKNKKDSASVVLINDILTMFS